MPRVGLEQSENLPGKAQIASACGAESGALGGEGAILDRELREVVKAWPTLAETDRAGIIAMVWGA